ncbi:MAG: hypothetical protein JWM19_2379 [Actinomycetia bacterium]|nr:hypothetical protein [Actinomycetes bacterium]
MGKASRGKGDDSRRERIAAARAAERRRQQRQRLFLAGGGILAVIVIVLGFVIWKSTSSNPNNTAGGTSNGPTGTALAKVVNEVTGVPASTLNAVGAGGSSLSGSIKPISGATLTANGKPEVFFDGAEYCPYCAANRWGMVVALSRFGTFTGLKTIHSSSTDTPANVPTWTFYGSTYTSKYITFTPVEETGNVVDAATGNYPILQTPTSAQQALLAKYNPGTNGAGGPIPFVDFGNKYTQSGDLPMLAPANLTGNWETIAGDLKDPSTANAKAVDAAANFMTAAICKLTNNQPATACTPAVQALQAQL